jgi:hypothetical protein
MVTPLLVRPHRRDIYDNEERELYNNLQHLKYKNMFRNEIVEKIHKSIENMRNESKVIDKKPKKITIKDYTIRPNIVTLFNSPVNSQLETGKCDVHDNQNEVQCFG